MSNLFLRVQELIATLPTTCVYRYAIIISCIWSAIAILQNPVIGSDGAIYLRAAETFLEHGLAAALAVYDYPGYSIVIAAIQFCTTTSLVTAAYLLNTLLFCLLVFAFIRLAELCYTAPHISIFAALVILCNPEINALRDDVYRDFGSWAFLLLALGFLIQFNRTPLFKFAVAWFLSVLSAAVFRSEALVLLGACLVYAVYYPYGWKHSAQCLLRLLVLPVSVLCAAGLLSVFVNADALHHLWQVISAKVGGSFTDLFERFNELSLTYEREILGPGTELAGISLLAGLLTVFAIKLLKAISLPYAGIYLTGLVRNHWQMQPQALWPLLTTALLLAAPPLLFSITHRFLQERYVMPLALLVSVSVSALLARWYSNSADKNRFLRVMAILALLLLLDGLVSFGPDRTHIRRAIDWFKHHTSPTTSFTANDTRGMFQVPAHIFWDDTIAFKLGTAGKLQPCERGDFYLHLHKEDEAHDNLWPTGQRRGKLVASFTNNRATHADIYRCEP